MQPDKIQFIASPRPPYQAIDLGVLMFRRWWKPLLASSLLISLPFFLPLLWLSHHFQSWWPLVLLWWLKPLFERVLLHFYSHAAFADYLSIRETVGSITRLLRPQLIASLTYRRLSPSRAMDLPVVQLEGLASERRSKRLHLLHAQGFGNAATWLTVLLVHVEVIIQLGLFALVVFFMPEGVYFDWQLLIESPAANMLCLYLGYVVIAPVYVGCGFSLYLNRRTALEGWDIELTFRQLHQRVLHQQTQSGGTSAHSAQGVKKLSLALLLSLSFVSGSMLSPQVKAQASQEIQAPVYIETPDQAQEQILEILEGEDFHQWETHTVPKWPFESEEKEQPNWNLPDWLKHLPLVLEVLLWATLVFVIGLIIYRFRESLLTLGGGLNKAKEKDIPVPTELFSLDVRQESLPDDVSAEAQKLWQAKDYRAAIALLYRASLAYLLHQRELPLKVGHTEGDCVRLVQSQAPEAVSGYFAHLTQAWLRLAYGHFLPSEPLFLELCNNWRIQFGEQEQNVSGNDRPQEKGHE